jgi:type II secretory pathway pseudopilin PulG
MTLAHRHRARRGQTLIELVISLGLLSILGIAVARLLIWQSRFYDAQAQGRAARSASRSGMNMLMSELRLIDASDTTGLAADTVGIESLSTTTVQVRVPFAFGVLCANQTGTAAYVSLLPVDSLAFAQATDPSTGGFVGYAWRDTASASGRYHFVESGSLMTVSAPDATAATQCATAGIGSAANGTYAAIATAIPSGAFAPVPGTPIYLYQRIRYSIAPSVAISGTYALWRAIVRTGTNEEIAAPFASTAQFRWYDKSNSGVSTTTAPTALANVRGIEVLLPGESERIAEGSSARTLAQVATSVFFKNRID